MKAIISVSLFLVSHLVWAEDNMVELSQIGETKVESCAACHGKDGNSAGSGFPKLAGQNMRYLLKQLTEIKNGKREIPTMAGQLDNFSEEDLKAIAAYYSSQKTTIGQADKSLVELGAQIYRAGNPEKGLTACTGCHSPTGSGNAPAGFPALSGQHAEYTALQLKNFRNNQRTNGPMMMDIAAKMSDKEIEAVSSYIQGLHD